MFNYHTHTSFCDGRQDAEEIVHKAIELGFKAIGFSGHAPSALNANWQMKPEGFIAYKKQINELRNKYRQLIQIYLGLEADFITDLASPLDFKNDKLDYIIGSVHFVKSPIVENKYLTIDASSELYQNGLSNYFDNDVKLLVKEYYKAVNEMVLNHTPDVIGHLDLVKKFNRNTKFFSENEKWYTAEVEKTIEIISKTNSIVEINTRGFYRNLTTEFYPSNYILNLCRELNVPVMINTDTHHSLELTLGKSEAIDLLKQLKFKSVKILFDNKWQDLEL